MARRTELQGVVHDILAAFISRNNDLNGYWALGQVRNWIESDRAGTLDIPLMDKGLATASPKTALISQRFAAMLQVIMKRHSLPFEWVHDARFSVELAGLYRLNCSLRVVSDLGREFEAGHNLLVRRHNPRVEQRRCGAVAAVQP